jgi:hypothetical protein
MNRWKHSEGGHVSLIKTFSGPASSVTHEGADRSAYPGQPDNKY